MNAHQQPTGSAYFLDTSKKTVETHTLAVVADNEPGVLAHHRPVRRRAKHRRPVRKRSRQAFRYHRPPDTRRSYPTGPAGAWTGAFGADITCRHFIAASAMVKFAGSAQRRGGIAVATLSVPGP